MRMVLNALHCAVVHQAQCSASSSVLSQAQPRPSKIKTLDAACMQIRAFASNPHSTSKQELNQSPLAFVETASEPGLEEALKRKDNIIRVRNAQISALWDELHTRQPWKNAIKGEDIVSFPEDAANMTRKLAVLGINTVRAAQHVHPVFKPCTCSKHFCMVAS